MHNESYGAIARFRARHIEEGQHEREGSHELYSRRRRRTLHVPDGPDTPGDFVIHDFVNEKTRSHILRAERRREDAGRGAKVAYFLKIHLVLVALGVGAGAIAASLDLIVDWLNDVKFGSCRRAWYISRAICCHSVADLDDCDDFVNWSTRAQEAIRFLRHIPTPFLSFLVFISMAVSFAAAAAFLVKRYAPYAAGSGVPEIKTVLSGVELKGYLSLWSMVVKIIGLGFAVSSSLNLGKEGPFVHLASALASVLGSLFAELRMDFNMMLELVTCGTAAGVSVAFNAPIGGVLFAFEEAATFFPNHVLWRSFFASTIAGITLKAINPFFNGKAVIFEVDHSMEWFWFEMLPFFVTGAIGGLIGVVFIKYNVIWTKFRLRNERMRRSPILEAVALVILTVFMSYFIDFLKLTNNEILTTLFSECSNLSAKEHHRASILCSVKNNRSMFVVLGYAALSKLFLTILTFGVRVPAGLFIPSMTVGACVGRMVGEGTKLLYRNYPRWKFFHECEITSVCVRSSIYALVGASSALAGVTQVSVSLVVIMFELTGGLSHLLPIMIGILAAKTVCYLCGYHEGIYDNHINMKRYPFLSVNQHVSHTVPAEHIMRYPYVVLPQLDCTIEMLQNVLQSTQYYGFPIVRSHTDMILTGNIVRAELQRAIAESFEFNPRINGSTRVVFIAKFDSRERSFVQAAEEKGEIILNFAEYRDRYLSQVAPETPMSDVHDCFTDLGVRMCFVTRHGRLHGLISKKDMIGYCDAAEDVPLRFFQ